MPQVLVLYLGSMTLRSLCLMAFAGMVTLCLRRVAIRHAVWTVALGSMMLLPIADTLVPTTAVPRSIRQIARQPSFLILTEGAKPSVQAAPEMVANGHSSGGTNYDWWQITLMIYASITGLLLLRTGIAHSRVWRLKRTSPQVETPAFNEMLEALEFRRRSPKLVESSLVRVPVTVGFFKPVVLLPQVWHSWSAWDLRAVLAHELTHVHRADWAITAMAALNRCLFWFNPFSWWLERHLCSLAEQATDEASLLLVGDAPRYAEVLLAFATEVRDGRRLIGGMAMARLNIRARINRILALQYPQSGILKRAGWIAIIVTMVPLLYIAAAAQGPAPNAATSTPAPRRSAGPALPQESRPTESEPKSNSRAPNAAIEPQNVKPENLIDDAFKAAIQTQGLSEADLLSDELKALAEGQKALSHGYVGHWLHPPYELPANITIPPNSYAFLLSGAEGGTVSFRRAEGTAWHSVSYGCQTCSFFVNETGIGPENLGGPGILFKMEEKTSTNAGTSHGEAGVIPPASTGDLTMTCRARECWATQLSPWNFEQTSSARFKFDVAKFDLPASNFSQVLIIISR